MSLLMDMLLKAREPPVTETDATVNTQPVGAMPVKHPVGVPMIDISDPKTDAGKRKRKAPA
eukprot:6903176-Prymnesium_polylepis.2